MADPQKVARVLKGMAVSLKRQYKTEDEEQMVIAAFAHALKLCTDEAVSFAANEWVATMKWFPTVVEFSDLARKHQALQNERYAALSPAHEMIQRYPIGRGGDESIAAKMVMERMMDAVGKVAPDGYLGRTRGYRSENIIPGTHMGLRDLGHEFNDRGKHAVGCARCHQLAAIAYEQAVDFQDSTLSWDRW